MAKNVPIEDWFERIESAVEALESGDLPLEEALRRYEEGLSGVRSAQALLDRFQARLDELRVAGLEAPAPPSAG